MLKLVPKGSNSLEKVQLTTTARAILGILWQAYPDYKRKEDLNSEIEDLSDARKELAYLCGKELVKEQGVPSRSTTKRFVEVLTSDSSRSSYLSTGYIITVTGIDAFRAGYPPLRGKITKVTPSPLQQKCKHKKANLVSIQSNSTKTLGAGISAVKAEKSSLQYIGIFLCPKCQALFYRNVIKEF